MNLTEALSELKEKSASKIPPEAREVMDNALRKVKESGIENQVLSPGDEVPDFQLPTAGGKNLRIRDLLAKGPVVVVFYRGGWCPYCNLNLHYLQKHIEDIKAAGASLIAISPETPDNSLSTKEKNELQFEILSDAGNKTAKQFGLVFKLPEDLLAVYKKFGIDLESSNGDTSHELPLSATFIIGRDGKILYRFIDADYKKRMNPERIVKFLNELPVVQRN